MFNLIDIARERYYIERENLKYDDNGDISYLCQHNQWLKIYDVRKNDWLPIKYECGCIGKLKCSIFNNDLGREETMVHANHLIENDIIEE